MSADPDLVFKVTLDKCLALASEAATLRAQRRSLLAALVEAKGMVHAWADQAPQWVRANHDVHRDLARLDAAIEDASGER